QPAAGDSGTCGRDRVGRAWRDVREHGSLLLGTAGARGIAAIDEPGTEADGAGRRGRHAGCRGIGRAVWESLGDAPGAGGSGAGQMVCGPGAAIRELGEEVDRLWSTSLAAK